MAKKETTDEKKVFIFLSESPVIKQTEQKVIKEYDRLEQQANKVEDPNQTTPGPSYSGGENMHDIPAAVAMAQPGEPMQNINVPIPISLHSRLKIMAAQQRINMKDLVALAIKEYVEKQEA